MTKNNTQKGHRQREREKNCSLFNTSTWES